MRRVNRRLRSFPEDDRDALVNLVEAEVKRCVESGLVNDQNVAKLWVSQLRNRGDSALSIQKTTAKRAVFKAHSRDSLEQLDY